MADGAGRLVGNSVMGLRRSVSFAGSRPSSPSEACLPALDQVPYYDWWDQQAASFVPDPSAEDGWARLRGGPSLERFGTTPARLAPEVEDLMVVLPDAGRLLDTVSRILVDEIYLASFLVGAVARTDGTVTDLAANDSAEAALATLPQGALRRILPTHRLDEISELLRPVVHAGVQHGLRHVAGERALTRNRGIPSSPGSRSPHDSPHT
ncbi:hypothetical protein [Oerskovia flava]|uniref:hypothetical protein n=1 Tax=Oerskovia flava TaxID=2986422 RepID=UPI00223F2406|nr:hypothetical protein [Oerskovia sp. JB1-3-2]